MSLGFYSTLESPVGVLTLRWVDDALAGVGFGDSSQALRSSQWRRDDARLAAVRQQLQEYFRGERRSFELPIALRGSSLQERTWRGLADIPFGRTQSYAELAQRIGEPKWPGARDVGVALGQNPIAVVLPCHRIIGTDGSLVGFGGGLPRKRWLLTHEGWSDAPAQACLPGLERAREP
jgi:methylated-DNA-[protein]-cysteine S-methyltransferase